MYRNVHFWSRFLPRHVDRVLLHASILVTSRLSRIWMREGIWAVGNWMLQRPLAVKVHFVATCTAKQLQEQAALDVLTSVHVRVPNEMVNIETSLITLKKRGSDEGGRNCIDSLTHWLFTSYIGLFVNFVNDICQFLSSVASQNFPRLWHKEIHAALSAAVQAETLAVAVGCIVLRIWTFGRTCSILSYCWYIHSISTVHTYNCPTLYTVYLHISTYNIPGIPRSRFKLLCVQFFLESSLSGYLRLSLPRHARASMIVCVETSLERTLRVMGLFG